MIPVFLERQDSGFIRTEKKETLCNELRQRSPFLYVFRDNDNTRTNT